jgi:hypothetical protein
LPQSWLASVHHSLGRETITTLLCSQQASTWQHLLSPAMTL